MQNHDLRTLPAGKHLRSLGAFVLGAVCAFQVGATAIPAPNSFERFMWTTTGGTSESTQILSFSNSGKPLLNPVVPQVDLDGGMPRVLTGGQLNNPSGHPYSVNASGRVTAAGLRSAAASVIKHSIGPILLGMALYDFAVAVKYYLSRNPDGTIDYKKLEDQTREGTLYTLVSAGDGFAYHEAPTKLGVCQMYADFRTAGSTTLNYSASVGADLTCTASGYLRTTGAYYTYSQRPMGTKTGSIVEQVLVPKTENNFLDDVASKSGWPSSDAVKLFADPLAYQDQKIAVGPLTVTGPATSEGTQKITNNTTNNTTKTETVTHQHTYQGNTVNTTTVTVVNVVDNSTGDTVSNETTTETPVVPAKVEDPCIANPDRNGCRSDEFDTPVEEIPRTTKTITFAPEDLGFAGGTCPANRTMQIHQAGITVTAGDWATTCEKVTTYAKPLILLMATFAALMIIFGGGGRVES